MKQQRRELKVRMKGEDVARLQKDLCRQGFSIPDSELSASTFGSGTKEAVMAFQKQNQLEPTGIVDAVTAERIRGEMPRMGVETVINSFMVHGYVRDETGKTLVDLKVSAVDKDMRGENALGEARTGADGYYRIEYAEEQFRRSSKEVGGPDLIVRAVDSGGAVIASSRQFRNAGVSTQVDLTVPAKPTSPENAFVVRGAVRFGDGRPAAGLRMFAYDKDLRSEELLGETTTDGVGHYEISYSQAQFQRAEKCSADLRISVSGEDGREAASSAVIFNARSEEQVDLVLGAEYRGPSEYEQLVTELTPLLNGLSFAELTEDDEHQDVTFLARETGQDPQRIAFLVKAHRLMQKTEIPAEVYYGLFRQGLPPQLPKLLVQNSDVQRQSLIKAADENIISASFGDRGDEIVRSFKDLIVKQAFVHYAKDGKTSLAALLGTVLQEHDQQEAFLTTYVNHTGSIQEFWPELKNKPEFRDKVDSLQLTLQLAAITGNHLPLVQALQRMVENQELGSLRDLARLDQEDWIHLISEGNGDGPITIPDNVPGLDEAERRRNYVVAMMNLIEDMFPTTFIAHREEGDIKTFLLANASFNISRTRLESYLARTPGAFGEIPPENRVAVSQQIKTVQRLYRIAPRIQMANVLREAGFSSAHSIVHTSQTAFMSRYGEALGGRHKARRIYENARQIHAIGLNLLFHQGLASQKIPLNAVPDVAVEEVDGISDWQTLFGSLDLCECEHCRSVYSPVAYLVDVLQFLSDRKLVDKNSIERDDQGRITDFQYIQKSLPGGNSVDKTAKDVLFERRPDLGEIELTCENTNIPVPYVDLVNEVMEDFVAPFAAFTPFPLDAALESDLNMPVLSLALHNAFTPPLSEQAVIAVEKRGEWWTIHDLSFTYTVRKENDLLQVTTRGRQTAGTPEGLAMNPQYMNKNAYMKLIGQVYPWTMPFHLWEEEARIYLEHLGVARHQIMEAFLPGNRTTQLTEAEALIALEYLGYSIIEYMFTVPTTGWMGTPLDYWREWGFTRAGFVPEFTYTIPNPADSTQWITSDNWLEEIRHVDVFLQQSGLEYKDLLDLLDTYWINPVESSGERKITIQSANGEAQDTCELKNLNLVGLDEPTSVKIPRFVRLWRKPGWSMRDLDQAFTAFRLDSSDPASLDMDFLLQLSRVKRLHVELKLPVEKLLSFWAPIGMATYIDHHVSGQPTVSSLYTRLFRNRAVTNSLDPAFTEAAAELTGSLSDHTASIMAAFSISSDDFSLLLNNANVLPRIPDPDDPTNEILDDRLILENLSRLYRHTTLAKALNLSVRDYLTVLELTASDPFGTTLATMLFMEQIDEIRSSGFSITELDYLLRYTPAAVREVAPTDQTIALVLDDIRVGLQSVTAENTFHNDPTNPNGPTVDLHGDLTRSKLALLNWDSTLIDEVIATLNDAVTYRVHLAALPDYEAHLAALPEKFVFPNPVKDIVTYDSVTQKLKASRFLTQPERTLLVNASEDLDYQSALQALFQNQDELQGNIAYDTTNRELQFSGVMTLELQAKLKSVSGDSDYQSAVDTLFTAPRQFVRRNLYTFSVPDFSESLPALPAHVIFPAALKGKVYFNATAGALCFHGAMTETERDQLLALSSDTADSNHATYQDAVNALYDAPNTLVPYLFSLGLEFIDDLNAQTLSEPLHEQFKIHEMLLTQEARVKIKKLDEEYEISDESGRYLVIKEDQKLNIYLLPQMYDAFLTAGGPGSDLNSLFDDPITPTIRFERLLKKLFPYLRMTISRQLVTRRVSEALRLETEVAEKLLTTWIDWPAHVGQKAVEAFLADSFAESDPNISIDRSTFSGQFDTYTLLHKIALIVNRFEATPHQVGWLFEYGARAGWLDLNALPVTYISSTMELFTSWERLVALFRLRKGPLLGERVLDDLFAQTAAIGSDASEAVKNSAKHAYLATLSRSTSWSETDLETLLGKRDDINQTGQLAVAFPDNYVGERVLVRLNTCLVLMRHLGMSAGYCSALAGYLIDEGIARSIRQAVRAKYDEEQWLEVARPWRDKLREKQRDALVAYLVTHPDEDHRWRDLNDVYAYFLIDVEMSACQMTSRIKQAISSAQLFVQRCLMNLEPGVLASAEVDEGWRQWKWMKNYRVWEANRKVFLYPENWIEPELRDDKSPFFKELEGELLQSDLTKDSAEKAILHYLEKLDMVTRLEIVGMYHEEEVLAGGKAIDNLHVFGRTPGMPHVYYYRRRVDSAYWTPWERVDLDIEGDHLIPVVWDRRLYLLWAIFTEKTTDGSSNIPGKYWEIQLAWSEYKNGNWTAKKISADKYYSGKGDHLHKPKDEFLFRTQPKAGEELELAVRVYVRLEADEYLPLAKFVCKSGENKLIMEKKLFIAHRVLEGVADENIAVYKYEPIPGEHMYNPTLGKTKMEAMMCVEGEDSGDQLYLPYDGTCYPALNKTPGMYRLLVPHQEEDFNAQRPFFFQDETRTFLVTSRGIIYTPPVDGAIDPGWIDYVLDQYLGPSGEPPIWNTVNPIDRINPAVTAGDPLVSEQSYPILSDASRAAESATMRMMKTTVTDSTLPAEASAAPSGQEAVIVGGTQVSALLPRYSDFLQEDTEASDQITLAVLRQHRFHTFYHPYRRTFMRHLNRDGVDGLLQRPVQLNRYEYFLNTYGPGQVTPQLVEEPYPKENVDFEDDGAYSQYNWELFFHAPLLIADRLSKNQRFEEAQRWFHFIFDPTDSSSLLAPQRYWRTKPFYETSNIKYQAETIPNLMRYLADPNNEDWYAGLDQEQRDYLRNFIEKLPGMVQKWRENPFMPHLIARMRTTAYQKTVVMKYIDNLIAWGDQLFRRDTIESINEAAQLYILAADILGKLPPQIPPRALPQVQTFNTLPELDEFSNALVQIEEFVPPSAISNTISISPNPSLTLPSMLYFGIPKNDKLLEYWDTVARRLFNIRHCLNIEGVERQLPLFEPPIEPALLVRAAAAGIDISSALNDVNAALPHYRFSVVVQKASELCAELKSLGSALLSVLEKRDAEELALLRAGQETGLLKLVEQVRKGQHDEAVQNLAALRKSREVAVARYLHYQKLLGVQSPSIPKEGQTISEVAPSQHVAIQEEGGIKMISYEKEEMENLEEANDWQKWAYRAERLAQVQYQLPIIKSAYMGVGVEFDIARVASALASYFRSLSSDYSYESSRSARLGQFALRSHDWTLQSNLAAKETMQIDKQILVAEIRKDIANLELENHRKQVDNARAVEEYMRDKYTNQELYNWMAGRISTIYFQAYQLAYDVAKRAERAYRHELGLKDSNFIQFGYWDNLKKGLLTGDQLFQDIKRMEVAYLDQNKREYEITKHISLVQLDPMALVQLKETGECFISIPEALFDLDYPGHYMRRIKSLGVTIPCVTGPYTGVPCTLTLTSSSVRSNAAGSQYTRDADDDSRFIDSVGAIQSIVTSSGQNDSGLFETNLRDERYLPFEGAGVISRWHIELPSSFRPFDYNTISDVVLHVRYTARDGGEALKQLAVAELQDAINALAGHSLARLFSARHEFSNEWYRFLHPADLATNQILRFDLIAERFPFQFKDWRIGINSLHLFLRLKEGFRYDDVQPLGFDLNKEQGPEFSAQEFRIAGSPIKELPYAQPFLSGNESTGIWLVEVNREKADTDASIPEMLRLKDQAGNDIVVTIGDKDYCQLNPDAIDDLILICQYTISAQGV